MQPEGLFKILDSVDSTNNYAMAKAHEGLAKHGMCWFAELQTAGKGQRGRTWSGVAKENIAMSIVLQPHFLHLRHHFALSMAVSLAAYDLIKHFSPVEMKIKWPNDLYWCDRKAGGILIENIIQGNSWKWAVAGIGININQLEFDPSLSNPVSIKQLTGRPHDVLALAKNLHEYIMQRFETLKLMDIRRLCNEYNQHLYKAGCQVRLKKGNMTFETTIKEVTPAGRLVTVDSIERQFDFGEVEWIP